MAIVSGVAKEGRERCYSRRRGRIGKTRWKVQLRWRDTEISNSQEMHTIVRNTRIRRDEMGIEE